MLQGPEKVFFFIFLFSMYAAVSSAVKGAQMTFYIRSEKYWRNKKANVAMQSET